MKAVAQAVSTLSPPLHSASLFRLVAGRQLFMYDGRLVYFPFSPQLDLSAIGAGSLEVYNARCKEERARREKEESERQDRGTKA